MCDFFTNFIADYQIGQSDMSLPLYRSYISVKLTELLAFQKCHLKKHPVYGKMKKKLPEPFWTIFVVNTKCFQ